jgi:hypothetical protein
MTTLSTANIASGGTFTAAAGSNRRVVALGAVRRDTGTPTYSATFGGVAMSADVVGPLSADDQLLAFSLAEASIPSGVQTLSVTATGGTILTAFHGQIYTLGSMNQTGAGLDSPFISNGTATAATTVTTASLTNVANSTLMAVVRNSTGDTISTVPSGWTTDRMDNSAAGMVYLGHLDSAAATSATYTWGSASTNWMYITVAYKVVAAAADPLMAQICL